MTPEQATKLLNECKQDYPPPVSALSSSTIKEVSFCVGGLFCQVVGEKGVRFPAQCKLALLLKMVNAKLDNFAAYKFAGNIIYYNDSQNFQEAWQNLYLALTYGDTE